MEFNISWLRSGHPILNVGDLSIEASQRLGGLLDQLRFPTGNSLSNSTTIVLINRYLPFSGHIDCSIYKHVIVLSFICQADLRLFF